MDCIRVRDSSPLIKGRDILTLAEFTEDEILSILDLADNFKRERRRGIYRRLLKNRSLAMLFQKPSTRTRVSFEVAIFELGGQALTLDLATLQLSRGETIEDTAKTLSQYVDAILARVYKHNEIVRLAEAADVTVINGLSNWYHPCQVLADLQTIREAKGRLKDLKVAWIGDGNNVCNTLLIGCSKMGMHITLACPPQYRPLKEALDIALKKAKKTGSNIEVTSEPDMAVQDADIVVTDSFVSMGLERERDQRLAAFLPKYQVNQQLMEKAKPNACFMHCLPAHRGEEVTDDVIDGPKSLVWQEAENRLHTQKALLCLLLLDKKAITG